MPMATAEKQREYQRQWVAARRANYLADKSCVRCGSQDRLEIDHIDPAEKVTHSFWSWSLERREAELAKCQVLCHDCHLEKSLAVYPPRSHGTDRMYRREKCRCARCKRAHADAAARYRAINGS